ncbi:MAG: hypothetical protein D6729_00575 [Deltaproteobacteria bacterium]|nr:MAG: hypothetical protein D6729_00575 [Deltaproteobacteria bacterium]
MLSAMRLPWAVAPALVLMALSPHSVWAEGRTPPPGVSPRVRHALSLALETGLDTNARRMQVGLGEELDVLGYAFARGKLALGWPRLSAQLDAEAGGKLYAQVAAENLLAARLSASLAYRVATASLFFLELVAKDKYQAGDPIDAVEGDPLLGCAPPPSVPRDGYRCNRRDYRQGHLGGGMHLQVAPDWSVRGQAGFGAFSYKPNPEFSYMGPDLSAQVQHPFSRRLVGSLYVSASLRFYDPASVTYRRVAGGNVLAEERDRIEQIYGGGVALRYRGPLIVSGSLSLSRSFNNSVGMDAWRGRLEVTGAAKLTRATTLVASAAFQIAYYPEGNILSLFYAVGDQDERQNSLALKLSQRLDERLSLIVKGQLYANELSASTLPFRRTLFQVGMRLDL